MELSTYDYTTDYKAFKQELDTELSKAADGFVKIGYLLKLARDTDILAESGYTSIAEFAKAEYGLTKDVVSRYININDRYSEGGNSPCLADRYKGFGVAKLAEMLTLPDAIVDNISADTTKEEIKVIKKEYAEEQEISDIEVALEAAEVEQHREEQGTINLYEPHNNMQQLIYDFLHGNPEEYLNLQFDSPDDYTIENIESVLAPSGDKSIISRIPGVGRLMMTFHGTETDIVVVNMRSGEKEKYTWKQLEEYIYLICCPSVEQTYKDLWKDVYDEEWSYEPPKEEPVKESNTKAEPMKPEERKKHKEEPKKPKKKESKVTVIKKDKPAVKEPEPGDDNEKIISEEQNDSNKSVVLTATLRTISDEELEDVINNSSAAEEYPEVAPVQPSSYSFYKEMPKDKLLKVFEELYNQMDEEYQGMKKYLRQYNSEGAVALMNTCNELHTKLIDIADVLNEMEDESND